MKVWKDPGPIDQKGFQDLSGKARDMVLDYVPREHIRLIQEYLYYKANLFHRRDGRFSIGSPHCYMGAVALGDLLMDGNTRENSIAMALGEWIEV